MKTIIIDGVEYNLIPKAAFREGDWVVNTITNDVEQIIEVTSNEYICTGLLIVSFDNQHLLKKWTIQDAKDGDVLIEKKHGRPFIFKGLLDINNPNSPVAYCGVDATYKFITALIYNRWTDEEVCPATKEQRDALIKAMTNAGYTFDFEKKELKRIGHKLADKIEPKFRVKYADSEYNVLEVKDIDGVTFYGIEDEPNHIDYVQAKNCARVDKIEQNPAWSKKDDRILDGIIEEIEENKSSAPDYDIHIYDRFISFLKSIKDRVQPQNTWKPSEHELEVLKLAAEKDGTCLMGLYKHLKKLREE